LATLPSFVLDIDYSKILACVHGQRRVAALPVHDTKEQIKTAIRKIGNNKSPGPDGLPAEFYKLFEDIIIEPLHEAIKDCWTSGCLTETMRQGDVVLILPLSKENSRNLIGVN